MKGTKGIKNTESLEFLQHLVRYKLLEVVTRPANLFAIDKALNLFEPSVIFTELRRLTKDGLLVCENDQWHAREPRDGSDGV